jgi:hypothetical protein
MRIEFPTQKIEIEEKKISLLFWEKKSKVSAIFLAVALVGGFALKMSLQSRGVLKDYFVAGEEFTSLQKEGEMDTDRIGALLVKHPELGPLFEHVLVDQKIFQGEVEQAKSLVSDSLERMEFVNPLYTDYARTSMMIEEGRYASALNETANMVEKIRSFGWETHPHIYVFALLRTGMLALAVGDREKAKEAFAHVKNLLSGEDPGLSLQVRSEIITHLNADQLSFFDFVQTELGE